MSWLGRPVAVGAVDVEQVDRAVDLVMSLERRQPHVADTRSRRRPGCRLASNASWSASPRSASAAISCGPRSPPPCGSIATTLDAPALPRRRARSSSGRGTSRSRRSAPARAPGAAAVPQPPRLRLAQPALDAGDDASVCRNVSRSSVRRSARIASRDHARRGTAGLAPRRAARPPASSRRCDPR